MLEDLFSVFQQKTSWLVNDADVVEAVNKAYTAVCYNKDRSSPLFCDYKLQDVANILWCYIHYFTTHPDGEKAKYYYDEANDRSDNYRKMLVEKIAQMANTTTDFTNKVLQYLYWAIKDKKMKPYILQPRLADKFKNPDYWYSGSFGGAFKFYREATEAMASTLKQIGYIITQAINAAGNIVEGAGKTLDFAGKIVKNLPYISLLLFRIMFVFLRIKLGMLCLNKNLLKNKNNWHTLLKHCQILYALPYCRC